MAKKTSTFFRFLQIFILVNIISFSQSSKRTVMNTKSFTCQTSGKHVDTATLKCATSPQLDGRLMGVIFYAKINKPIFEASVTMTVWNKQFTPNFIKIFDFKQDMCAFLNGTEKNLFLQKGLEQMTAKNKMLKDLFHPCPYKNELKVNMSIELDQATKAFVRGEYKSEIVLHNKDDKNILTVNIVNEPMEIDG